MRKIFFVSLFMLVFVFVPAVLYAQTSNELLAKIDKNKDQGKDVVSLLEMTLIDKNNKKSNRLMKFYRKTTSPGKMKKIYTFLKPADAKGVAFLSLSEDEMYTYIPAFSKVRRVASHVKNEKFMGTDMSYDDMSEGYYSEKYNVDPKYKKDTKTYTLTLYPKNEDESEYQKLLVTALKTNNVRVKIDMFDKKGKLVKKFTQGEIKIVQGYASPHFISIHDLKINHKTEMRMSNIKYDSNLKDKFFSQRYLKRVK